MSDPSEIISPPYPLDTCTVPRMLQLLVELHAWLTETMIPWAQEFLAENDMELPMEVPEIPSLDRMNYVALRDLFRTFSMMRSLREGWDSTVRDWEMAWGHPRAIKERLQATHYGVVILREAFIDPETREAKAEKQMKKFNKLTKAFMKKMGVPDELIQKTNLMFGPFGAGLHVADPDAESYEPPNFDELFHGPSNEEDDDDEE